MSQGSKKPIPCIVWGLLVSSVRKLLEKVGDLRDIAILVQSNFGIFDIYRSTLAQSNCLGLSSSIFKWVFWIWNNKIIFGCRCGPVFSKCKYVKKTLGLLITFQIIFLFLEISKPLLELLENTGPLHCIQKKNLL